MVAKNYADDVAKTNAKKWHDAASILLKSLKNQHDERWNYSIQNRQQH